MTMNKHEMNKNCTLNGFILWKETIYPLAVTCSNLTIEKLEQGVGYVQS